MMCKQTKTICLKTKSELQTNILCVSNNMVICHWSYICQTQLQMYDIYGQCDFSPHAQCIIIIIITSMHILYDQCGRLSQFTMIIIIITLMCDLYDQCGVSPRA